MTSGSSSRRRRSSSSRAPRFSVWSVIIGGFAALCLVLGGSSNGGLVANVLLQLIATLLLAYGITQLGGVSLSGPARLLLLIVGCWVGWCLVQLVPLPPWLWTHLPGRDLLEQRLQTAQIPLPWLPMTLSVDGTIRHLCALLPPLAIGATILVRPPEDRWLLRWVIPAIGFVSLLFGVAQLLGGQESHLYLYQTTNNGLPVGLMANANHQATLMLCAIPFVASFARSDMGRSMQARARDVLLAATVMLFLIGMAICGSYAADIIAVPVVIASWLIARPRSLGKARYVAIAVAVVTVLALAAVLIAGPNAIQSHTLAGESQLSRPAMYAVAARTALHFFPIGSGFGSFVPAYKLFEEPLSITYRFVNHSHSEYIELALEGGLPAMLLILSLLIWWFRQALAIWLARASTRMDRATIVATGAILAHSMVDYPARTSAIAMILAAGFACMVPRIVETPVAESAGGRHLTAE